MLGGGLLDGSVTLVFGAPGVGKSTLLLQVLMAVAALDRTVLLVSAEESAPQVRARADRLGELPAQLLLSTTADVARAESAVVALDPDLVVVDSIQTISDAEVAGAAGSVVQVRACVDRLGALAKRSGTAVVLVGHVTKDGDLAGPRLLEHLVDTVVSLEGDRHHALRVVRALKHRFAATGEVGLFEMGSNGLSGVDDPGPLLLGDRLPDVPGSAVTALLQGRRALVVELQALACPVGPAGPGRLQAQGVDHRRLAFLLAVLEARAGVGLSGLELFVSSTGGVRATEPAADLGLALAVASAAGGVALPGDLVIVGEVGLAGEVRLVPGLDRRLAEAARLGFTWALVPASGAVEVPGMEVVGVRTVTEAILAVRRHAGAPRGRDGGAAPGVAPAPSGLPPGTIPAWSTAGASP